MRNKCNVKYLYCMRIIVNAEALLQGWDNYRTILMQVTHKKCKGVGVFVKQFFDG